MGKKLGATKGAPQTGRDLNFLNPSKIQDKVKVRLLGDVCLRYRYWIKGKDGKKNVPIIALGFNPETENWDRIADDPLYPIMIEEFNDTRKEFCYTINCIDRTDGQLKILILKNTILKELTKLANNEEYGDPTDPDTGYDITITREKTGALPQNVKYGVIPARNNSPLTAEERELELFDLDKIFAIPSKEEYVQQIKEKSNILDEWELRVERENEDEEDSF